MRTMSIFLVGLFWGASAAAAQVPTPLPTAAALAEQRSPLRDSVRYEPAVDSIGARFNRWALRPVRTQEEAAVFWGRGDTQFLSSGAILFNSDAFESTLELISDVVGIFRVGVGVTVAAPKTVDGNAANPDSAAAAVLADASLSRLVNSGGTLHVSAAVPLLYRLRSAFNTTWALVWSSFGSTETPQAGTFLEDPAISFQSGLDFTYERRGVGGRINFLAGVVARGYWYNGAFAEKTQTEDGFAALLVPRVGLTLLEQTRIDVHWRAIRSDNFDSLGSVGVTIQQTTR